MDQQDSANIAANFSLQNLGADFIANPYPVYQALREREPIKLLPNGSYFLTRYDDLIAIYKNTKSFSSDKKIEFTDAKISDEIQREIQLYN